MVRIWSGWLDCNDDCSNGVTMGNLAETLPLYRDVAVNVGGDGVALS